MLQKMSSYINYEYKKDQLWKGYQVSVRDYYVRKAIKEKKGLRIIYKNEYMLLDPNEVKKGEWENKYYVSIMVETRHGQYVLVNYSWRPDGKVQELVEQYKTEGPLEVGVMGNPEVMAKIRAKLEARGILRSKGGEKYEI